MKLVLVESPTKAKTISNFLGKNFIVESTYGHIRDLPKSSLGVDVENNFKPHYVIPKRARPALKTLKTLAKKIDTIILATDEDREGEAIAWHVTEALKASNSKSKTKKTKNLNFVRIAFHEITKEAIEEALNNP